MSKITVGLKNEITRQSDVTSKPLRDNFTNYQNAINDNQDQITAISTSTTNNETVLARGADHASLKERLDSMWAGQPNYLKYGGVVSINGGDAQKVDVTTGEARVDGSDIIWSADTSETIPFTSANSRYDVVCVSSSTTTGGQHLEIVRGAESANPVLPDIAETQRALWVLTIGTATVALSWDARSQGCTYFSEGRWMYEWKIQDAFNDVTDQGTDIYVKRGCYYETLVWDDNITVYAENGADIYNATTSVLYSWASIDLSSFTNATVIYNAGINSSFYRYDGQHEFFIIPRFREGINNGISDVKEMVLDLPVWDMDASITKSVAHGLSNKEQIINVDVRIVNDADSAFRSLKGNNYGSVRWDDTNVYADRTTGGTFDHTDYDSTASSRGRVYVKYTV